MCMVMMVMMMMIMINIMTYDIFPLFQSLLPLIPSRGMVPLFLNLIALFLRKQPHLLFNCETPRFKLLKRKQPVNMSFIL